MFRNTMLATATAATAIAAALLLTACSAPEPTGRPAPAAAAPAADTTLDTHTRQVFNITWGGVDEAQRTTLCDSLLLLGPDRAAEEMGGTTPDPSLDWALMVDLLTTECDNR